MLLAAAIGIAQNANDTINRMVLVESTYNPIIAGAVKHNFIPEEVKPTVSKEQVVYAQEGMALTYFDRVAQPAQAVEVAHDKGTQGYAHLGYGIYNNLSALAAYKLQMDKRSDLALKAHADGWNGKIGSMKWHSYLYDMGINADYTLKLDKATLEQEFPDYQVVYHHQWATEATLYNAVMQGVPAGVSFHTVIIDIKSFKPSGATMSAIFSYFASQGCRTVFVSQYDAGDFDNSAFFSLVDRYCQSNLSTLYAFVYWALDLMYDHNGGTLSDTTILIDGRLIDPSYSGSQPFDDRFPFYDVLKQMLSHPNVTSTK